ncbi:MAG: FAD-dependent oxidoreductase [Verrucomicrobiota bacterium]
MKTLNHSFDFCVIGGGLAGMCAAVAAARHGIQTALIHDRPVLGGNASSEIRMWICGAHGKNMRETGIIEEILLENRFRNPEYSYAQWDALLYEKVAFQENLTLFLNCSCTNARMAGERIDAVEAWQLTTETWHIVKAQYFADCSGDSILAPLSGAEFRLGREASSEFNESIAPAETDDRSMGMSCLIQARETERPQRFCPPPWAYRYDSDEDLPNRDHGIRSNFWWLEIGGEADSVHAAEENRDELLKIAYGVWDHVKNRGEHGLENWVLDWVGFLPGKRESRRYIGDHVLTQNDVEAEGRFHDIVAYGGWTMDDHHPAGFRHPGNPTTHYPAPSPFGIPYRCLYSRNIENLFFAGRNISATHAAMSATRVMATCAVIGQAVGTAASLASKHKSSPRGVGEIYLEDLQQQLLRDDCFLPWYRRTIGPVLEAAELISDQGDPELLRSGVDRPFEDVDNAWKTEMGGTLEIRFKQPRRLQGLRLVFDSDLKGNYHNMPAMRPLDLPPASLPPALVRNFRVEVADNAGTWREAAEVTDNHQRLVRLDLSGVEASALKLTVDSSWGEKIVKIFAIDVE